MARKTTHTIRAEILVKFRINYDSPAEFESEYVIMDITYTFLPGARATGPTYSCGGTPADPHEVEAVSAKMLVARGVEALPEQINDWAAEWLDSEEGFDRACDFAHDERYAERDVL